MKSRKQWQLAFKTGKIQTTHMGIINNKTVCVVCVCWGGRGEGGG